MLQLAVFPIPFWIAGAFRQTGTSEKVHVARWFYGLIRRSRVSRRIAAKLEPSQPPSQQQASRVGWRTCAVMSRTRSSPANPSLPVSWEAAPKRGGVRGCGIGPSCLLPRLRKHPTSTQAGRDKHNRRGSACMGRKRRQLVSKVPRPVTTGLTPTSGWLYVDATPSQRLCGWLLVRQVC